MASALLPSPKFQAKLVMSLVQDEPLASKLTVSPTSAWSGALMD